MQIARTLTAAGRVHLSFGHPISPSVKPLILNVLDDIGKITVSSDLIAKVGGVITNVPDIFAGASSWALPELKQSFGLGLTTSHRLQLHLELGAGCHELRCELRHHKWGRWQQARSAREYHAGAGDPSFAAHVFGNSGAAVEVGCMLQRHEFKEAVSKVN
ncbi:hypothetical protein [Paenibacillus sp. 2RAB27]|uniref:hypothetical protein n=1 Tax=Paenibacillus sp. 2RAB27 TaxID=3232991 RepID=UPI003F9EAC51